MRTSSVVTIPVPCPEPWEQMTVATGGRHCAACQKTVQDFSTFSDQQLAGWLATYTGDAACGRFRTDQLERPIYQEASRGSANVGWVRWTMALLLGWQTARAQSGLPKPTSSPTTFSPIQPKVNIVSSHRPLISPEPVFYVTGQIVNEDGEPYAQAMVINESSHSAVGVDRDGKFRFPIYASDQTQDSVRLGIVHTSRQYVRVSTRYEQAPLHIIVPAGEPRPTIVGGGLMVIRQEPAKRRSFWQFLSGKRSH